MMRKKHLYVADGPYFALRHIPLMLQGRMPLTSEPSHGQPAAGFL